MTNSGEAVSYSQGWQEVFALSDLPAGAAGGAGRGGLRHSAGPWSGASGAAAALRTSTEKSRGRLGPAHEGVAAGAAGFAAAGALAEVLDSWERRLVAVRGECAYLNGALGKVAREMGETDGAVEKSVRSVDAGNRR